MTPEQAAEEVADMLDFSASQAAGEAVQALGEAREHIAFPEQAAMLAGIAAVWVQLHTSLANAPKTTEPAEPPLNRLAMAMTTSTPPADRREQAREWITGFMSATDDDRVNCVALLLCAADDALECALNHKRTEDDGTVA